ncbi:hypothetical protein V7S43_010653 [Phytophthora oleae]|uniref:Uncharacterized protein n=1 Tax=Phytophthora oleae TaxID=2107226 RepID=A0ABD3FC35_9STRA
MPELDQMFFYRCCTASLENIEARDRCTSQRKHPSLHRTCLGYWSGRERVVSYAAESLVNGDDMINEMAKLMKINAGNMIALPFRRWLHQYIRFRYAPKGKIELKYKDTKRLVDSCYRVKLVPELDEDENPTGKMVKSWPTWDETDDPVEKELREWLEIVPWHWQIRDNSAHFVHKLYMTCCHGWRRLSRPSDHARSEAVLAVARSDLVPGCVRQTQREHTLHGRFAQILKEPKVAAFLKNEMNIVPTKNRTSESQLPFSMKTFQTHRSEILRKVFDVEEFETENRKFVDEVNTNGYGASITMIRPLTTTSVVVVEKKVSKKKRKKNDGTAEAAAKESKRKKAKTPEEIAEADSFAKELFKLGPEYFPDVLIGIDPGMRSLVTAVSVGRLRCRRRRK